MTAARRYCLLVNEWLRHLGLTGEHNEIHAPVIINVDRHFDVHCCMTDGEMLLLLAEGTAHSVLSAPVLLNALDANRPVADGSQPVVAVRDGRYLQCWLQLPIADCDLPRLVDAFRLVVRCAERFLASPGPNNLPTMADQSKGFSTCHE